MDNLTSYVVFLIFFVVFVIVVCLFLFFLHIVFLLFVAHKKTLDFTSTTLRKAYITVSSVIDILKLSNSYCVTFHQTSYDTYPLMVLLSW